MSVFPDWKNHAVKQRRPQTGCIPTSYEIITRAAGITGIDLDAFQDDFDLDKDRQPGRQFKNHFVSVAQAIKSKYRFLTFECVSFPKGQGNEKLKKIEESLAKKVPVLVSLPNEPLGGPGWHIMPIVDATDESFTLLEYVDDNGTPHTREITKQELVRQHNEYAGGDEVAFLAS